MSEIGSYEDAALSALETPDFSALIAERDRLLAFNAELDRERVKAIEERDEALARATCDGSFERQGKESHEAAIAALWNTDPTVTYESPAQVIGWLQVRILAAEAALKIEQETFESFRLNSAHASKIDRQEAEAEAAALRKALEPFATWGAKIRGLNDLRDDCPLITEPEEERQVGDVTVRHLRDAVKALASDAGSKLLAEHAAELDKVEAALKRYGRHLPACPQDSVRVWERTGCTCGLDAALEKP